MRGTSYDRSNFEYWQNCNETSCMLDAKALTTSIYDSTLTV
jgi:hypothetical protein